MNKWYLNLEKPNFPVEIWNHRDGEELTINLRNKIEGEWRSLQVASFEPGHKDYKEVLKLWYKQRDLIWYGEYTCEWKPKKKWWEFWR